MPQTRISPKQAFGLYPVETLKWLGTSQGVDAGRNLFHPPEIGGVITWYLWPPRSALLDDRNQLFAESDYKKVDSFFGAVPGWKTTLANDVGNYVLCRRQAPVVEKLLELG